MNQVVEKLINEIAQNFNSIYKSDLTKLENVKSNNLSQDYTVVNIGGWSTNEIEKVIEGVLKGINYYTINVIPKDKQRNAFPIASYNSILNGLKNNQTELIVYTKRIPNWNQELKNIIQNKGISFVD